MGHAGDVHLVQHVVGQHGAHVGQQHAVHAGQLVQGAHHVVVARGRHGAPAQQARRIAVGVHGGQAGPPGGGIGGGDAGEAVQLAEQVGEAVVAGAGHHAPERPQQGHRAGGGVGLAGAQFGLVLPVAAEQLVGPIAAQGHGHMAARALGQQKGGQRAAVGEGPVHRIQEAGVALGQVGGAQAEGMVGAADVVGHGLRVGALVEVRIVRVADAEGVQAGVVPGGQRAHDAAVEPAAEEGAQGHIGQQPQAHRAVHQFAQLHHGLRAGGGRGGDVRGQVVPGAFAHAPGVHVQQASGLQLVHPAQHRVRPGCVVVGEVLRHGVGVHRGGCAQGDEGAQFAGEAEHAVVRAPQQGLDAEAVAGHQQGVVLRIVDGQGEEAVEGVEEVGAAGDEQAQHHLGIGVAAEGVALGLELGAQLGEVEQLAVVHHGVSAARIGEGLMAGRGGVDDAQPAVPQHGAAVREHALIVRTAMGDAAQRLLDARAGDRSRSVELVRTGDAAHAAMLRRPRGSIGLHTMERATPARRAVRTGRGRTGRVGGHRWITSP